MFNSKRVFQIWDYSVSHGQLLLRSAKADEHATNIDIVFWGVRAINLDAVLKGVALARTDNGYRIESNDRTQVVTAAGCKVFENSIDIFTSTLVDFSAVEQIDRGKLLAGE